MKEYQVEKLQVKIMPNRTEMGKVAAEDAHRVIVQLLAEKEQVNMNFAAAERRAGIACHL